jgi:hypothetical protein
MDEKIENLDEMTSNELLFQIKQLEADHESIKLKMLKDFDQMVEIEQKFDKVNKILLKRLKGE